MVNDQEPRYRLVDADGNVVGSLFAESDGTLKLQEGTSGNDNQVSLTTQGVLEVEQFQRGSYLPDRTKSVELSDDSVTSIDKSQRSFIFITYPLNAGLFSGGFDTISSLGKSGGFNVVGGDTTLSGTTGTDGKMNVSVNDNILYVENRTGSQEGVNIQVRQ